MGRSAGVVSWPTRLPVTDNCGPGQAIDQLGVGVDERVRRQVVRGASRRPGSTLDASSKRTYYSRVSSESWKW